MILLYDALTAYLAGLTTKLNEKEIWWKNELGKKITIELVSLRWKKYTVRYYYDNGNLCCELNYNKDDQRHGMCKWYYEDGNLHHEFNYYKNQLHGLCKSYYEYGNISEEFNYHKGYRHGLNKWYNLNSNIILEENYKHGIPHD